MIDVIGNDACTASTYASQARHFPNIYIYIYIYTCIYQYVHCYGSQYQTISALIHIIIVLRRSSASWSN
jgi:hypothetical protein